MQVLTNCEIEPGYRELSAKLKHVRIEKLTNFWLWKEANNIIKIRQGSLDPTYTGPIKINLFNMSNSDISLNSGTPVAMLVIRKYEY